jgi:molybdate-binding protein
MATIIRRPHSAVAFAVKFGKAIADIGIGPVANLNGLAFGPLADEAHGFFSLQDRLDEPPVKQFLSATIK